MAKRTPRQRAARARRRLAKLSYRQLRRLTPKENVAAGKSTTARNYVPAWIERVTKKTATISARQYESKKAREQHGLTPEQATEARKQGGLDYVSADQRERVAKAAQTREANRKLRDVDKARAEKYGLAGRRQTRKVLDYLEEQFGKHDRYLAGRRDELPEAEYRETVELAFRYLGADDERVRRMQMSPAMMAI